MTNSPTQNKLASGQKASQNRVRLVAGLYMRIDKQELSFPIAFVCRTFLRQSMPMLTYPEWAYKWANIGYMHFLLKSWRGYGPRDFIKTRNGVVFRAHARFELEAGEEPELRCPKRPRPRTEALESRKAERNKGHYEKYKKDKNTSIYHTRAYMFDDIAGSNRRLVVPGSAPPSPGHAHERVVDVNANDVAGSPSPRQLLRRFRANICNRKSEGYAYLAGHPAFIAGYESSMHASARRSWDRSARRVSWPPGWW
ncbi:hypothetical protein BJY52DRAFT_1220098 [Lactarius psammicola]|nr:hypothetical protein BJY52DRAFT_1220098 [Lactarius psammicola]